MTGFQYLRLGLGGLALLCGALIFIMRVRSIVAGRVAEGVVVDERAESVAASRDGHVRTVSHAIFEFQHEGKTYRCQSSFGAPKGTTVGTKVRVRYLPSDPQSSGEIDSPAAMWGFPVMALIVGGIFVAVGLYDAGFFKR